MEIRDHALIYGLLAKKIIEHSGKENGEKLIEEIKAYLEENDL